MGIDKPVIEYAPYERDESMFSNSDNMPADPEQADWDNIN